MLKLNEKDNPAQNTMDSKKNKIRNLIGSTIITFNKRVNKLNDEIKDMKKEFNEQMTVLQDLFVKAFNENPNNSGPVPLVKKTSTQFSVSPVKGRKNNSILGVSMKGKQSNNFSKSPIRTNETCKTTKVKTDQGKLIISNLSQSKATEGNFDKALNSKVNSTDTTPKRFISNKRMSTDSPVKKKEPIKNTRNSAAIVELNSDKHQIDARRFSITDILASGSNLLEEIKKNKERKEKKAFEKIENKYVKAFFILATNDLVPLEERLKFHSLHRSIKEGLDVTDIIKSSWAVIQSRMGVLENLEANKDSIKEKLLQYPTKTAQNHLNFVSKEGELELKDKFNQTEYHSIIEAAFKLINVLCGENTEVVISDQTLGDLLLKYNCINLKSLFSNVIYKNIFLSEYNNSPDMVNCFNDIITDNEILINTKEIARISQTLSYLSFSFKEIYEYLNYSTGPYESKYLNFEYFKLKHKAEKLKKKFIFI